MSKFNTREDYSAEIARVYSTIKKTESVYLKRDLYKYLKRLQREMKKCTIY